MAIPVDAVRLPENVERGAIGGPVFNTALVGLDSGFEQSQVNWAQPRHFWDVGYGVQSKEDFYEVLEFFMARRGRARGFLFKDWSDFELTNQIIGTGDGVEDQFQIVKTYADTVLPFTRTITRPIASSLVVTVNGSPTTSYTLLAGGIIDFVGVPTSGHVIRVTGEFDVPVRFDVDQLRINLEWSEAGSIPSIPVRSIRE